MIHISPDSARSRYSLLDAGRGPWPALTVVLVFQCTLPPTTNENKGHLASTQSPQILNMDLRIRRQTSHESRVTGRSSFRKIAFRYRPLLMLQRRATSILDCLVGLPQVTSTTLHVHVCSIAELSALRSLAPNRIRSFFSVAVPLP